MSVLESCARDASRGRATRSWLPPRSTLCARASLGPASVPERREMQRELRRLSRAEPSAQATRPRPPPFDLEGGSSRVRRRRAALRLRSAGWWLRRPGFATAARPARRTGAGEEPPPRPTCEALSAACARSGGAGAARAGIAGGLRPGPPAPPPTRCRDDRDRRTGAGGPIGSPKRRPVRRGSGGTHQPAGRSRLRLHGPPWLRRDGRRCARPTPAAAPPRPAATGIGPRRRARTDRSPLPPPATAPSRPAAPTGNGSAAPTVMAETS
jgi:hypothetical protein